MYRKIAAVLVLFVITVASGYAQTGIQGTVTDSRTGEPLPGVNVIITELERGSPTNVDGQFEILNLPEGEYTLTVSYIGYKSFSSVVEVGPGLTMQDILLEQDILGLEEVVVTGVISATSREKTSFTVEQLGSDMIEKVPAVSASSALAGKVAGVKVTQSSGLPGSGAVVQLRGTGSLTGSNEPLYIVDGVILSSSSVDIDPQDIANIEVVKGAAAASLYGSRAQNGIIQITTKRGDRLGLGQTQVRFRSEYGMNELPNKIPINQSHWFRTNGQGNWLTAAGDVVTNEMVDASSSAITAFDLAGNDEFVPGISFADNPYPGATYSSMDRFFDPGYSYRNYLSVAQNLDNTNFLVSFSNTEESGVIDGIDGYNRKSIRLNIDHRLSSALNLSSSGYYSGSKRDDPQVGGLPNPFYGLLFQFPNIDLAAMGDDGLPLVQPTSRIIEENPLYGVAGGASEVQNRSRIMGAFNIRFQPVDWFNLEGNFSYDRLDEKEVSYLPLGFQSIDAGTESGSYGRVLEATEAINSSITASFYRDFGDLSTQTRFRFLVEDDVYEETEASGSNFIVGGVKSLEAINPENRDISSDREETRARGYFGITNLDFKDRYILDLMVRRDGSSLFGADERWHTYYRVSGAYRISEEPWWFASNLFNEFKLRYSLGTAGARPDFTAQYETFDVGVGSIVKETLGNNDLKPELQTEREFGLEMGIMDRVFIQLVYAMSTIEDQLLEVPLPGFYGYESQWQNAGTVEANTFEATLEASLLRSRNTSLSMGLTFDMTDQEITEFNRPPQRIGPYSAFYLREDETFGAMYGAKFITGYNELPASVRSNQNQFDVNDDGYVVYVGEGNSYQDGIAQELWGTSGTVGEESYDWGMPIAYVDEEGADFHKIGSVVPDFNLGWSTNFNHKGLGIYMVWDAQIGGDLYNGTRQWPYRDFLHGDIDQAGKADGDKKPIQYYSALYRTNSVTSHFVEDGSYIKLRELSLEYTFNQETISNIFGSAAGGILQRLSIGVVGRNLLTFTDYSGYDPEVVSYSGGLPYRIDNFGYPVYRTFTGKIEFQF